MSSTNHANVVITGTGLVCALGGDRHTAWQSARTGASGLKPMRALECDDADSMERPGGEFDGASPDVEPREIRMLERAFDEAWGETTAKSAVEAAPDRRAVVLGTTLAGMRRAAKFFRGGAPAGMQTFLAGPIAADIAERAHASGPCVSVSAACASGLSSIAHGVCMLRAGVCDVAIVGGYDPISEYAYGGFRSLRLVAEDRIRPFMRDRKGMKLGEGYGIVILERQSDAQARGAHMYATVAGFGESSDGFHLTQPHPEGAGLARAIGDAIGAAESTPGDIDLISLHGTGTPANDAAEFASLERVFGGTLPGRRAVAHKAACGHTLGGAGAVEIILTMRALHESEAPPTSGATAAELEFPALPMVTGDVESRPMRRSLGMSLGFGGSNAAVVLDREIGEPQRSSRVESHDVVISGAGVFGPFEDSVESWWRACDPMPEHDVTELDEQDLNERAGGRRARRMSTYAKLVLAAARDAARDFDEETWADFASTCGGVVGSAHGASAYSEDYYRQLVDEGVDAASPWWFAEGVPNVGSAHLSMELGIHATAQTVLGTRTSGLDALVLAWLRVQSGVWPRAIVAAADEQSDLASSIYADAGLHCSAGRRRGQGQGPARQRFGGFVSAPMAASVIAEPHDACEAAGRTPLARVTHAAMGTAAGLREASGGSVIRAMATASDRLLEELGDPAVVITTGNRTWIDSAMTRGLQLARARTGTEVTGVPAFRDRVEAFGASGLLAAAAWMRTGVLPGSSVSADDVAVIDASYDGAISGIRLRREQP